MSEDGRGWISDEELTALALAAPADPPIPDDAVPFDVRGARSPGLLPEWYMPAPSPGRGRRRAVVFGAFAISLLIVNIAGVCVTYGLPDPVWR